jgi:hypothetical protein
MYKQCNLSILDENENDETLANSIKQSTQAREKRRNEEKGPKSKPKELNPKWVMFQHPHQLQEAYQKEKGMGNLKYW